MTPVDAASQAKPRVGMYQRYLPPDASGAGRQAVTLAAELRRAGIEVTLIGDRTNGQHGTAIEGVPVRWLEPRTPGYPALARYWARLAWQLFLLRREFDILHVHSAAFDQSAAVVIGRMLRKPVLVRSSLSGEFEGLSRSRSGRLQRRVLRLCNRFVVLSARLSDEFVRSGLPAGRLLQIANGVDRNRFYPVSEAERQRLRVELGLPRGGAIVVFHGVFIERKGLHWLIEQIAHRLERWNLSLLLVGGGARDDDATGYTRRLRSLAEASPNPTRIVVREHRDQVQHYLQAADLFVLPSASEGMPNALLEAMAVGLVPIATRTSGTEDVVRDGESGFLFEPGDGAGLVRALECCCAPDAAARLTAISRAAVERIDEAFSIPAVAKCYARLYDDMTGGHR